MSTERGGANPGVVLDLSSGCLPVSHATAVLAGLGYEVWKVEWSATGDPLRHREPVLGHPVGVSVPFLYTSRHKRWLGVHARHSEAASTVARLRTAAAVSVCDATTAAALGIEADVLVSPFGTSGPWHDWQASAVGIFHAAGLGYVTPRAFSLDGDTDSVPTAPGGNVAEYYAGLHVATAVLAALRGPTPNVEISVQEALIPLIRRELASVQYDGVLPTRQERLWKIAPSGLYQTGDGYVYVSVIERAQWDRLCELVGRPDLAADERFATGESRFAHHDEIDAVLRPWLSAQSTQDVVAACGARGVPVGAASGPDDLLADPQLLARSFFRDTPFGFALPASPIRLAGTREPGEPGPEPEPESDAVPSPGRDTRHVLLAAGFTDEQVRSAVATGVVFHSEEAFA